MSTTAERIITATATPTASLYTLTAVLKQLTLHNTGEEIIYVKPAYGMTVIAVERAATRYPAEVGAIDNIPVLPNEIKLITTSSAPVMACCSIVCASTATFVLEGSLRRDGVPVAPIVVTPPYTTLDVLNVLQGALYSGSNVSIAYDDVLGRFTFTATSPAVYTAENARNDVGAALSGTPDRLSIIKDDLANTITADIDATFVARVAFLESARSLIQTKDQLSSTSVSYVTQPGTVGNYTSTPYNAAFNVAGDSELILYCTQPDWTPAAQVTLASRWIQTTANRVFRLKLETSGNLTFEFSTTGTNIIPATTTVFPVFADGVGVWIKHTRSSTGGQNNFYYSVDPPGPVPTSWTTWQLNRTTTTGAMFASTVSGIEIGGERAGTANMAAGNFYRLIYKAGIGGTIVADMDPSGYATGTTWVGPSGNTWTLNGTAAVVSGGISNTAAEVELARTDAFANTLGLHDGLWAKFNYTFSNTSAGGVSYQLKLLFNGQLLFLPPVMSVTNTAAGQVYQGTIGVYVGISKPDGSEQVATYESILSEAVTGTDLGSSTGVLEAQRSIGQRSGPISTVTTVPAIQLMVQMSAADPLVRARPLLTTLHLNKA